MGVDGRGKGGGPTRPGPVGDAGAPEAAAPGSVDETFSVDAPDTAAATSPGALEQLQRGDITVDQYLDARVRSAVEHLEGRLGAEELDFVKQSLREQMSADPVLVELVRRVTGGAAPSSG
jgi:hypothetical protein